VTVYAATANAGKLRELQRIFASAGWRIVPFEGYAPAPEGARDYAENAALKTRALHAQLEAAGAGPVAVLGDDSGLEVTALGNRPGVLSARYGGEAASWHERRASLLAELDASGSADRSARFVCTLHLIDHESREFAVRAEIGGRIAVTERGGGGFSYDAIFELPERGLTFAELTEDEKNAVSHRARAAKALLELLRKTAEATGCSSAR
jgi:XTP/dITP diphosphohydrolase